MRSGFTAGVLDAVLSPDVGLVIWRRLARFDLRITVAALGMGPLFRAAAEGTPEAAARSLVCGLPAVHWPLYADIRRLGRRFSACARSPTVGMRLEHVADDARRGFHVDAGGLKMVCTYSGPGTEWIGEDEQIRRLDVLEVAIFKGSGFPVPGPRIGHRSPVLLHRPPARRSRLVLYVDEIV